MKPWTIIFVSMWLLAQVGAFVGLMQENAPLFIASLVAAWLGGAGAVACMLLRKGQSLGWLAPIMAIWALPILLAYAGITLPPSVGMMFWVAGIFVAQRLPDHSGNSSSLRSQRGALPVPATVGGRR